MSTTGKVILQTRIDFLKEFIPIFNKHYRFISNLHEEVSLEYESSIDFIDNDVSNFKTALMTSLARDRAVHHTTVGPHKDDLEFKINGYDLKKYASQGQQKSYLLALKLAQFEFIKLHKNTKPLLLLDDVYDKLDEERFTKLLEMVSSEDFGQVFITDTHPERMNELLNLKQLEHRIFLIEG